MDLQSDLIESLSLTSSNVFELRGIFLEWNFVVIFEDRNMVNVINPGMMKIKILDVYNYLIENLL